MSATSDKSKRLQAAKCGSPRNREQGPVLRFSPVAWAKLIYLRDRGSTEVGAMGIAPPDDPLLVEDLELVRQECTVASVLFDDEAVADFFDQQVDHGKRPEQFFRVWIHTHPGDSPEPSRTDERTFARVFGSPDWAVMFILAEGGRCYTRLQFSAGPGASLLIPVEVDFSRPFGGSDELAWEAEYLENVNVQEERLPQSMNESLARSQHYDDWLCYEQYAREGEADE